MWRIGFTKDLIKAAKRHGIYDDVLRRLRELEEMLRVEPERTLRLLHSNPTVFTLGRLEARRMYLGDYRLLYHIDYDKREIIFFDLKPRGRAYKRRY